MDVSLKLMADVLSSLAPLPGCGFLFSSKTRGCSLRSPTPG